jgi:RimJ/RimL family protein N-acetyltransferase
MNDDVSLREVRESDLETFFEHQMDPEATRMAAFPSRDHAAFMAHWTKIMGDPANILQTVLLGGEVVGNVVNWEQDGERKVGYWIGRAYWGRGVATSALSQLLATVRGRPLVAHVAKHNVGSIRVLQKCGFTMTAEDRVAMPDGSLVEDLVMTLFEEAPVDERS